MIGIENLIFYIACIFGAIFSAAIIFSIAEYIFSKLGDTGKGLILMLGITVVCCSVVYGMFFAPVSHREERGDYSSGYDRYK